MDDAARLRAQLEPLASALHASAQRDAEAKLSEARTRATASDQEAASKARKILAQAQADGEAAAEHESARRLVAAKRRARRRELEAQRAAYEALFAAAADRARKEPTYGELQDRLKQAAASVLGGQPAIVEDPQGRGGVLARADGRSVDLTLPVLVRRCITRMGKGVAALWS